MTNMERIQTLPRYKLAEFLMELAECPHGDPDGCMRHSCIDCWIEWLNENDD